MLAKTNHLIAALCLLVLAVATSAHALPARNHAHSHAEYLPAPKSTLEAIQQGDALITAMRRSVDAGRLNQIHDLTEMFAVAMSGMNRFGSEGLSESRQKRLDDLTKNLRRSADELHTAADEEKPEVVEPALKKLEKLYKLVARSLPEAAEAAEKTPLPVEQAKKLPGYEAPAKE